MIAYVPKTTHQPIQRRCLYCEQPLVDGKLESGWTGRGRDWMTTDGDFGCFESPINDDESTGGHDPDIYLTRERNVVRVELVEVVRPWKGTT